MSALHRREVIKCILEFFGPAELVNLQLTCKHWYEVKIPIALPVVFTEFGVTQRKLVELLESEPVNLHGANLALWKKMKRFKPDEQLRYWAILDPKLQPFDYSEGKEVPFGDNHALENYCYPIQQYAPYAEDDWEFFGLRPPGYFGHEAAHLGEIGQKIADDPIINFDNNPAKRGSRSHFFRARQITSSHTPPGDDSKNFENNCMSS